MHAIAIATALLAVAAGAGSFPDPAGDVRGGLGPDLTSVSVGHTRSTVTFRFRFATAPPLAAAAGGIDMLVLGIDVPPRGLKRGPHGWTGLDYDAGVHGSDTTALLVKAGRMRGTIVGRPRVAIDGRTLRFSVSRRTLGDPAWIELVVAAGRETADRRGGSDEAPARGAFHYRLR